MFYFDNESYEAAVLRSLMTNNALEMGTLRDHKEKERQVWALVCAHFHLPLLNTQIKLEL